MSMGFAPLESVSVAEPCEDYAVSTPAGECDPTEKPGVVAWRAFLTGTYGGNAADGISRDCSVGSPSDHHAGRAYDWMRLASDPAQAAEVDEVLAWLLGTDLDGNEHAMYRRLGLTYLIWNRQVWSSHSKAWAPYTRPNPHTDHVHFSFGIPGSLAQTSFYRWLGAGAPLFPPIVTAGSRAAQIGLALVGLAAGGAGGYYAGKRLMAKRLRTGFGRA
jgi:hypothetical protein